jgi:hypothetical protein
MNSGQPFSRQVLPQFQPRITGPSRRGALSLTTLCCRSIGSGRESADRRFYRFFIEQRLTSNFMPAKRSVDTNAEKGDAVMNLVGRYGTEVAAFGCAAIVTVWTVGCGGGTTMSTAPSNATSANTYTLSGQVVEGLYFPVSDARVEIIGGPMNGSVAMTDGNGRYQFTGVSGALQVRASKAGYTSATRNVSSGIENVNFDIEYDAAPAVAGVYRLTFTFASSCQLPDDARRRTYTATIKQEGGGNRAVVTLTDAQFWTSGYCRVMNSFDAVVHGHTLSLSDYGGDCGVVEQLAAVRYLMVEGTGEAMLTDPIQPVPFSGTVMVVTSPTNTADPIAQCNAPDHQVLFERIASPSHRK